MEEQQPLLHNPPPPSAPPSGFGPPPPPVDLPPPQGAPPPYHGAPGQYQQQPVGVAPHYQQQPVAVPPTQTVVLTNNINFGETPVQLRCPNCQKDVITNIHHESGLLTWISVGVLFILGFWLCCWLPFLFDPLKDVVHTCPNCRYTCGIHKKIG